MNECALSILLAMEALLNHIKDLCGIQASNIDVIIFFFYQPANENSCAVLKFILSLQTCNYSFY